jgi:Tol biopolymer transport system component
MKKSIILLLLLAIFFSISGCSGEKQDIENADIRIKEKKEILVEREVSNIPPMWCGLGHKLIYDNGTGTILYDVETGKKGKIAGHTTWPMGCTPDGDWFVYLENSSIRPDDENTDRWVVDLWRYEFSTKRRQRFAVVKDNELSGLEEDIFSPTGSKIFLGWEPRSKIKMPEPKWEIFWTQNEKEGETRWLPDASGLIRVKWTEEGLKDKLVLVLFDPEEKSIVFELPFDDSVQHLKMSGVDRAYMLANRKVKGFEVYGKNLVVGCDINGGKGTISCSDALERGSSIRNYDLLPDSESIVFMEAFDHCVRIMRKGDGGASCITSGRYNTGNYVNISPDSKWVAFTVFRERDDGGTYQDLYLVEFKSNYKDDKLETG